MIPGGVVAPGGFKAAAHKAGLRASGRRADCALVVADEPAVFAGVFTTNVFAAAPVLYCREIVEASDTARAVLVNAGQANAATGSRGMEDSRATAALAAECLGISPGEVLVESTGVIGQRIKMDEFTAGIPALAANLRADEDVADAAATAICTTDLVRKTIAVEVDLGGGAASGSAAWARDRG